MIRGDKGDGFPANALIAGFVFDVLRRRGVLHRSGIAQRIRDVSDAIPERLDGDQRVASLSALRHLLDNPHTPRRSLFDFFKF
jgi:hypothetical protein